ncbi:MAG: hypothetical protein ABIH68_01095 [bacterium]
MKFDKTQRKELSRVFLNLCQADFIAVILGKIITPEKITNLAFILGVVVFTILFIMGILLSKTGE